MPSGLLGLVVASLIAAYMSTISSHLNWGSSYVVNDWYKRFYKPSATEKELVNVGRISTLILMVCSAFLALALENALGAFNILLQIGAGTGLIFILRWFWWRINAYSEITAMIVSFAIALYFEFLHADVFGFTELADHIKLISGIALTTFAWLAVTFMTQPTEHKTLLSFYKLIRPAAAGWKPVINQAINDNNLGTEQVNLGKLPLQILAMLIACVTVYAALFGTGYLIYGNTTSAIISIVTAVVGTGILFSLWNKIQQA